MVFPLKLTNAKIGSEFIERFTSLEIERNHFTKKLWINYEQCL